LKSNFSSSQIQSIFQTIIFHKKNQHFIRQLQINSFTLHLKVLLNMEDKYLQDIQEIKKMMSRSTQFISLSGISGILAGIYALVGAFLAYQTIYFDVQITESSYKHLVISYSAIQKLWLIAASVLVASVITGILLSYRKATKTNDSIWNPTARRLVINFSIPLFAGGIFIFSLIQ
jgi:uncharacterized membrane protein